jgi:hypothetical protein
MKILKLNLGDFINFIYIIVALGSPVIHIFIFLFAASDYPFLYLQSFFL